MKYRPVNYCCEPMKFHLDQFFKDPKDADTIIEYSAVFDEYGLPIKDGGSGYAMIHYCPWCGTKLPESKRDEWFEILEGLGFKSPFTDDIPVKFKSADWHRE